MKTKSLKVSEKTWKKLMRWKLDLGCESTDELINRIIKITKASELQK